MVFALKKKIIVIIGYRNKNQRRNRVLNNFKKLGGKKKKEEKEKKKKQPHNSINKKQKQKNKTKKKEKKKNDHKNSKDISGPFSGVVGSVGSLPRRFPLFNFFCLLVSSVSDFHPDTGGAVVDAFLFFFQAHLFSSTVFEGNDLLFWVPDVLCQHSEVALWNLLNVEIREQFYITISLLIERIKVAL